MALGSVVGRISPVRKLCSSVSRLMAMDCHADISAGISVVPVSDASKSQFSSEVTSSGIASAELVRAVTVEWVCWLLLIQLLGTPRMN